jgi:tetratricopeptide (TPR) repeat protein
MYNKLQDYENAVKYLKITADIMFKNKEFSNLGELYNNMGISYYHLNYNDSAITYYHKAIDEYNRNKELKGTARAYLNMANTYAYNLQNYDSAFHYYDMAMQTSKGVIDALKTKVNGNKGKVYLLKGDYNNAEKFLKLALDQARESNNLTEQLDNYHELYNLYKRRGKFHKAIENLEKYNEINDSINVANARITIANLEAKFENEKNLLKINELNTRREADRKVKHLLLAGLVLLSFILLLTILFFVQKRKKAFLKRELLRSEKEKLEKEVQFKSRQLTSQALMMIQKNRMLNDILSSLKSIKHVSEDSKHLLTKLNQQIKYSIQSGEDWEMFRHYFEEINPDFYPRLLKINSKITPAEQKLSALIKLNFNIKETASLLNISPDSVKTTRHILRKKLGLDKNENIHEFLNSL